MGALVGVCGGGVEVGATVGDGGAGVAVGTGSGVAGEGVPGNSAGWDASVPQADARRVNNARDRRTIIRLSNIVRDTISSGCEVKWAKFVYVRKTGCVHACNPFEEKTCARM